MENGAIEFKEVKVLSRRLCKKKSAKRMSHVKMENGKIN